MSRFIQIADGLAVPMGIRRMEKDARHRAGEYVGPDIDWQQLSPDVVDNGFVKVFPLARSAGGQEADEKLLALKKRCEMAFIHFEEAKRRKAEKQIEETSIEWRWPADATAIEGNDQ